MSSIDVLIRQCLAHGRECEWIEFKHNNADPDMIGQRLSALANSATLAGQSHGFMLWGIEDGSLRIVGTSFALHAAKGAGNQGLELWLATQLEPRVGVEIIEDFVDGQPLVALRIPAAATQPVAWKGTRYIRIGQHTSKLTDHPAKEQELWRIFQSRAEVAPEDRVALADADDATVLRLLDYAGFFRLLGQPLPESRAAILEKLAADRLIVHHADGRWAITVLGGLLFAVRLADFPSPLARKQLRVIKYRGTGKMHTERELPIEAGYAVAFTQSLRDIGLLLPANEVIGQALRTDVRVYPELAVRELVANALIHQDLSVGGSSPMVEIYDDRLEVTNPGRPLIDTRRFVDEAPRSRNERIASLLRRMNICEEKGSGIDKVLFQCELHQLPAPDFRSTDQATVTVLFAPIPFADMDRTDRIRACYLHACLRWVTGGKALTNESLRTRFGLGDPQYPTASRIIKDAVDQGWIRPQEQASSSRKDARYVPFWV